MQENIVQVIIIALGLFIYFIRPRWIFLFYIFLSPLFLPIVAQYYLVMDVESLSEINNVLYIAETRMIYLLILIELFKNVTIPKIPYIYIGTTILFFYILVVSILHDRIFFEHGLALTSPFILISMNSSLLPSLNGQKKILLIFLVYELLWCILNINGVYIYMAYYMSSFSYVDSSGETVALISGTFKRFNDLANFLSVCFVCLCLERFYFFRLSNKMFWVVSSLLLFMIVASGARISVVVSIVGLIMSLLLNIKRNGIPLLLILFSGIFLYLLLLNSDMFYDKLSIIPGADRIIEQFSEIVVKGDSKGATTSYSSYLINHFFEQHPVWGNWMEGRSDYAYGGPTSVEGYKTDARVAFTLVEYGVFGFFVFIIFFFLLFWQVSKMTQIKRGIYVFSAFFFILTMTENGIFDSRLLTIFYLYCCSTSVGDDVHYQC